MRKRPPLTRRGQKLVESAAEGDDSLIEKFFAEGNLGPDEIRKGLAGGMKSGKLFPVLCGAGHTAAGVASLLDFIVYAAPSPEGSAKGAAKWDAAAEDAAITRPISEDGQASCFIWKTAGTSLRANSPTSRSFGKDRGGFGPGQCARGQEGKDHQGLHVRRQEAGRRLGTVRR